MSKQTRYIEEEKLLLSSDGRSLPKDSFNLRLSKEEQISNTAKGIFYSKSFSLFYVFIILLNVALIVWVRLSFSISLLHATINSIYGLFSLQLEISSQVVSTNTSPFALSHNFLQIIVNGSILKRIASPKHWLFVAIEVFINVALFCEIALKLLFMRKVSNL